jgi:hypothetical protein
VAVEGDPVAAAATGGRGVSRETAFPATGKYPAGKSYRTICRKVYLKYRHLVQFLKRTFFFEEDRQGCPSKENSPAKKEKSDKGLCA